AFVPGSAAKCSTQARRTFSSSLPLLMRSPPACATRLVGFRNSNDVSGCPLWTTTRKRKPKSAISSADAPSRGNCTRVADATPLSLWQVRHWALSRTGYTFPAKSWARTAVGSKIAMMGTVHFTDLYSNLENHGEHWERFPSVD